MITDTVNLLAENLVTMANVIIDSDFLFVMKSICCFVGISMNVSIAAIVIRHRETRCKPRNIFLLAIMSSYLLFFIPDSIEMIYRGLYSVEPVCQVNVAIIGVSHALLLLNMFLALTDRYVAINFPVWYREKMTVRLACVIIVIGNIVIGFFLEIDCIVHLRCDMWQIHANVISTILFLLLVSCAGLNFIVYQQTKMPPCETISSSDSFDVDTSSAPDLTANWIEFVEMGEDQSSAVNNNNAIMAVDVNSNTILDSIEMEATRTLISVVTSFVSYQSVIFVTAYLFCRVVFGQLECDDFKWLGPWIRKLTLIPAFYCPIIVWMRNSELRA